MQRDYYYHLAKIKNYVNYIRSGCFHEEIEVIISQTHHGVCNYDRCTHKRRMGADMCVMIYHSNQNGQIEKMEGMYFHRSCLGDLLRDERLSSLN